MLFAIIFIFVGLSFSQEEDNIPYSNIKGKVVDFQTQQIIPGSTIRLLDTKLGAIAKSNGEFLIKDVPVGRYEIVITSVGYEPYFQQIAVTSGKEVVLNIQLNQAYIESEEVIVSARKNAFESINESALISSNMFTVDEVEKYAGSRNDPAQMAKNFAGVVGAGDERNDIIVRGGSPTELLWRLDGLDIPNPNHFATQGATGGPISALNSRLLDNSDFLTGAFPSMYGDKLSAVFDLRTRKGNRDKYEFIGQFGFNGFELGAEGPIGNNSSFIANYRYSFLDFIINTLGIDFSFTGIPRYQDANFKYDLDLDENNKISLTGLFAKSNISIVESDPEVDIDFRNNDIKNGTELLSLGINWQTLYNKKTYGTLIVGTNISSYSTELDAIKIDSLNNPISVDRWIEDKTSENFALAKYIINYSPNSRNFINAGLEYRYRFYNLDYKVMQVEYRDSPSPYSQAGNTNQMSAFINWNWRLSKNFTLNSGVYSQYLQLTDKATIEPRLSARYTKGKSAFNFAYGLHNQSLPLNLLFGEEGNDKLDFMRSQHLIAGWNYNFSQNWQLKVESYYKYLDRVPVERNDTSSWSFINAGANYGSVGVNGIQAKSDGEGQAYGVEISLTKRFSEHYYLTSANSFYRQKYKGSDGIERNGAFDNRFVSNILAGYELEITNDFTIEFGLRFSVAGGAPYSPLDLELSRQEGEAVRYDNLSFSERNDIYNRIDFRIDFRQNYKGYSIISFFTVENLLNTQNVLTRYFNPVSGNIEIVNQLGLFPYGGFRVEF